MPSSLVWAALSMAAVLEGWYGYKKFAQTGQILVDFV